MTDPEYNSQIEELSALILADKVSLDEQDDAKLKKYHDFARKQFHFDDDTAGLLVNEAFLYLKLKASSSVDPLQHGDQFGAGFS